MKLSTHFALEEFLRSEVAARMGRPITIEDPQIQSNLVDLCEELLEPLRLLLNAPITVLSGVRPDWLNTMIGGAKHSAHISGRAADIVVAGMTPISVCTAVKDSKLPFDQCLLEFEQWCHVAIAEIGKMPRREVLTATSLNATTIYYPGIVSV